MGLGNLPSPLRMGKQLCGYEEGRMYWVFQDIIILIIVHSWYIGIINLISVRKGCYRHTHCRENIVQKET